MAELVCSYRRSDRRAAAACLEFAAWATAANNSFIFALLVAHVDTSRLSRQTTTNGKRREPSKATSGRVAAAVTVLTLVLSFVCEARQIGFLHRGGAGNS